MNVKVFCRENSMDTSSSPQLLFAIVAVAFVWQHAMATCHPLLGRDKEEEEPRTRGEETFTPLQSVSTCSRYDDVRLHCDTPQRVVVHEARFTSQLPLHELEQRCNHTDPGTYVKVLNGRHGHNCSEDIRSSVNQRCSGQHACLFSWTRDHVKDPEARARCKGEGIIHVAYRCVDFASNPLQITSVCSRRLGAEQSYGYLMSPGFPQFYVAPHHSQKCNWTIQGRLGQTVTVNVLDVRLRPTLKRGFSGVTSTHMNTAQSLNNAVSGTNPSEECGDLLRLTSADHGGSLLADICVERQRYFLNTFSSANAVSVQFISSGFAPHRGFILEYKISGCPTLPAPRDGFLESRNTTAATYRCRRDFFFADTITRHKTLLCLNGTRWTNGPLGECLSTYQLAYNGHLLLGSGYPIGGKVRDSPIDTSVSNVIDDASSSSEDLPLAITAQQANRAGLGFTRRPITWSSSLSSLSRTMSEYADVIIPSIIVCLLLLGNAIIVFYIYRLKRQNKQRVCARSPIELPLEDRDEQKVAPLATI
ncbi:uncharacterized protein LOC111243870 isoform X2 [Varroa destructor]|uniref:CUB domain-containing protein n=1 Tax=Varroa destructor TaxID=109461 RepID=A0A7M7J2D9_VARDE|nr:uncharacterized protein LOC111243870 isoform X2 [Varroa destructor]XP_022645839.1 uncharacterized protein LOC111243870 isoform X2 [Varroa destructor]